MSKWQGIAAMLSVALCSAAFAQDALPTDADLKSSYCMGVLESKVAGVEDLYRMNPGMREHEQFLIQGARNDLHRLHSYMVPRVKRLDLDALVAAKNRGIIDYQAARKQGQFCLKQCPTEDVKELKSAERWGQCVRSCNAQEPASVREDSCKNINWLPF